MKFYTGVGSKIITDEERQLWRGLNNGIDFY